MISIILLAAFALRLVGLNQSLWLDEAISVNIAKSLSLKSIIFNFAPSDVHPPLSYLFLKAWITFFGSSEISTRIPQVIVATATVYMVYLIAKKLYEEKTGLIAATLLATAPLHIYYSQEVRMYALTAFFVSLSVYFFISILKKDNLHLWIGFIISTALALYTDYLPYLMLPVYLSYTFTYRKKINKSTQVAIIPSIILVMILVLPSLFILPQQLKGGLLTAQISPTWGNVVGSPTIKNLILVFIKFTIGRISYDNNVTYALLFAPAGIFIILLTLVSFFRLSATRLFLWFWLIIPIIFAFILAYFIPIFSYHRLLFVLPAFYIILASAINTLNWTFLTRTFLAIFLCINIVSAIIYFTMPKFQRENWRGAAAYVANNSDTNTVVLFESDHTFAPFDYYNSTKIDAYGGLDSFNPTKDKVKERVEAFTKDKSKVFVFQYLSGITDPQGILFKHLTNKGFKNSKTMDFEGVGFIYEFDKY